MPQVNKFKDRRVPAAIVNKRAAKANDAYWDRYAEINAEISARISALSKDSYNSRGILPSVLKRLVEQSEKEVAAKHGVSIESLRKETNDADWMAKFGDEYLRTGDNTGRNSDRNGDVGILYRGGKGEGTHPAPVSKKGEAKEGVGGLLGKAEYDDFALIGDPMTHHLQGEEPASPEQEEQLAQVVKGATDFIFGDNMHSVIRNLKGQGELYQAASKTAFQILLKQKMDLEKGGKKADPSVFFAETGAVPIVMDALWSVAKKVGIPGANDPDQYAGALINVMKLAGERVGEAGDEESIREAEELATTMAMTREDGSMIEDTSTAATIEAEKLRKKELSTTIGTALLGGQ